MRVLDTEGTDALTFRRLAAFLGVGVASLYWYVESKEALVELALDRVLGEVAAPAPPKGRTGWQDALRGSGLDIYDALQRHRWSAAAMMLSSDRGPNTLRLWDAFNRITLAAGFTPQQSFDALGLIINHVLASAHQDQAYDPTGAMTIEEHAKNRREQADFFRALDPELYPTMAELGDVFEFHDQRQQFADGLDLIIGGLERLLRRKSQTPR